MGRRWQSIFWGQGRVRWRLYVPRFLCSNGGAPADLESTSSVDASTIPVSKPSALDFDTGIRHIIAPAVIGVILGILAERFLTPNVAWPSPPQAAMLGTILLSPILYFILLSDEKSRWWEYSLGILVPGSYFIMIWFSGWGALFCGGYLPLLIWVYQLVQRWNYP